MYPIVSMFTGSNNAPHTESQATPLPESVTPDTEPVSWSMNTFTAVTRRTATRTLNLVMGAAAIAWVLFVVACYIDLTGSTGSMWNHSQPQQIRAAGYVMLAAIVVLGLGALFSKRSLAPLRASIDPPSALVGPVSRFSSLMLIISAALAAWMVFVTFMSGLNAEPNGTAALARMMNLYLPIVLYTALVITLILAGFVFLPSGSKRHIPTSENPQALTSEKRQETADTPRSGAEPGSGAEPRSGRRTTGLAYAVPIVATAFALILGLIIYDLTRDSLQVWIWVAIFAIVGTGVFMGTVFASRGHASHDVSAPVLTGAKNLNFVLTIIFAFIVASMSLGYGSSAVQQLLVSPSLTLSAYNNSDKYTESVDGSTTINGPSLSLWGSDLKRGSDVTVVMEPGDKEVVRVHVDRNRWANADEVWPENLTPGTYEFTAQAEAADGVPLDVSLTATVKENGDVDFPADGTAHFGTEKSRLLAISAGWLFGDLLPAGVLLALGIGLVSGTILVRNPERPVTE